MNRHLIVFFLAATAASFSCNRGASPDVASEQTTLGGQNDNDNDDDSDNGGMHKDAGHSNRGRGNVHKRCCVCADAGADSGASGIAATMDMTVLLTDKDNPDLVNAWGLAFNSAAGPAWIADNGSGKSSVLDGKNALALTVTLPTPSGKDNASPTGLVFNKSADAFNGDAFIFVTESGTVAGWQRSLMTSAATRFDNSGSGAIYKGATIAGATGRERLYATDFHNGKIDVFDRSYRPVQLPAGAFVDSSLPSGFAPFNADTVGNLILVTYAKQDADAEDDEKGAGNGFIDVFDTEGVFLSRLASNGPLDSPWGLAVTPDDFGPIPHRLLVGNFGDGHVNVYDLELAQTGLRASFEGQIAGSDGSPLAIDGLWALRFQTGPGFDSSVLYFTAGPGDEEHGAYGRLDLKN